MKRLAATMLLFLVNAAPGQDAAQPSPDSLRGPTVSHAAAAGTLIERDFDGKVKPLDTRPEEAALALLDLSAEERQRTGAILTERLAKVSALTREHQDLFLKIQSARQSGDRAALPGLMREFRPLAADLLEPPLAEQLSAVLTPEHAAAMKRLVKEYGQAMTAEGGPGGSNSYARPMEQGGENPGSDRGAGGPMVAVRMEANLLIREMARSLAASVAERRERTDRIVAAAQATPEQEATIRRLIREFGETTRGKGTAAQRGELMRSILDTLTPEQRRRVVSEVRD